MLVARKDKPTMGPRYSSRLDTPNVVYALSNPMKASREMQMLNFLKETLVLAKNAHHIDNFVQNLYLHCPNTWGLFGICLRKLDSSNTLSILTQISKSDKELPKSLKLSFDSKAPALEAIRFNVGIFFETRNALASYSSEGQDICANLPELNGLVCLPITSREEMWGSVEFLFEKEVECDEGIQDFFSCIALIVGTAIDHSTSPDKDNLDKSIKENNSAEENDLNLTPRLKKIAIMIADGKTNAEIAHELCYSESAARYETVKLYAMLRVKNRAEAGAAINKLKLRG